MKPEDRYRWLAKYIHDRGNYGVDVLDRWFVDAYVAHTGARERVMLFGANYCAQLGRDLLAMKRKGRLERGRIGLAGNWQPGFPTWVWSYKLTRHGLDMLNTE